MLRGNGSRMLVFVYALFVISLDVGWRTHARSALGIRFRARFAPDGTSKELGTPKWKLASYKARNTNVCAAATEAPRSILFVCFCSQFFAQSAPSKSVSLHQTVLI